MINKYLKNKLKWKLRNRKKEIEKWKEEEEIET